MKHWKFIFTGRVIYAFPLSREMFLDLEVSQTGKIPKIILEKKKAGVLICYLRKKQKVLPPIKHDYFLKCIYVCILKQLLQITNDTFK